MNLHDVLPPGLQCSNVILFLCIKIILAQWGHEFCKLSTSADGLSMVTCITGEGKGYFNAYKFPRDYSESLQVVELRPDDPNAYNRIYLEPDMFNTYPKLRRIIIRRNFQIYYITQQISDHTTKHILNSLLKVFKDLTMLEYLEMTNCYLEDWITVRLPKQLKRLNFDNNRYQFLDVHWGENLEEISVRNNSLNNIPKLSVPGPPLKILRLSGNPLKEMTAVDVAGLCELTLLEMNFAPNAYFVSKDGYCQCLSLKKWVQEIQLKGLENVTCYDSGDTPSCSNQVLEDARAERKKCPLLKTGATSSAIRQGLKYTFMAVLIGLLLAALILYLIRHFHLREYWRNHHLRMNQPTSIKMEEGEEELFKSSSEKSEDSSIEG